MQFANPIWLLGLTGVLVPLAIHLLSRKEGKLIRIGSLRHLDETSTRQFKSIKLNEILLLILRSLLVLWFVFLLSGITWPSTGSGSDKWLLIEKGLEKDSDVIRMTDSLAKDGYKAHAFAKDFPLLGDSVVEHADDYWQLIEQLEKRTPSDVVIISLSRVNSFRGMRLTLPQNFKWITKEIPSEEVIISTKPVGKDSLWLRTGKFSAKSTTFRTSVEYKPQTTGEQPKVLKVAVIKDKAFDYDSKIFVAALKAIDEIVPEKINIQIIDPTQLTSNQASRQSSQPGSTTDWTILLTDERVPHVESNRIVFNKTVSDQLFVQVKHDQWLLTKRLNSDDAIEESLTMRLAGILFPEKESWRNAARNDLRTLEEKIISTDSNSSSENIHATMHTDSILIVLLLITLLAERLISFKRNQ